MLYLILFSSTVSSATTLFADTSLFIDTSLSKETTSLETSVFHY